MVTGLMRGMGRKPSSIAATRMHRRRRGSRCSSSCCCWFTTTTVCLAAAVLAAAAAAALPAAAAAAAAPATDVRDSWPVGGRALLQKGTGPTNCGKEGTLLVNPINKNGTRFGTALGLSKDASIILVGAPFFTGSEDLYPSGAALSFTEYNGGVTCVFDSFYLPDTSATAKWMGAQVAMSRDGKLMASVDGFEGAMVNGRAVGNRPVVNLYIQNTTKTWLYLQQLPVQPRKALINAIAVSFNRDGSGILVSYSVASMSTDHRGSAQVFLRVGPNNTFAFSQDLADLNQPAGSSYRYGMNSAISPDGSTIAVATSPAADASKKILYMYRRLSKSGSRYQIVDTVTGGDMFEDPWAGATDFYNALDANLALNPNGNLLATVEGGLLMLYEVKSRTAGKEASSQTILDWQRRCMIAPPNGYRFRGNSGSLSLQQPGTLTAKVSVGAYAGVLDSPTDVLVLTYRISIAPGALCPTVPLYSKSHYDSWSQFGAAVQLSEDGLILVVGAPQAQDANQVKTVGAVYVYDVSIDSSMSATQYIRQDTNNGVAGCAGGYDANGNPCTYAPKVQVATCKPGYTLLNAAGQKVMISQAGEQVPCQDAPASIWSQPVSSPFVSSTLSPYTTISSSIKGGVGVPLGQNNWAPAASLSSLGATGQPAPANIVPASYQQSVSARNGGIPAQSASVSSTAKAQAAALLGFNLVNMLFGGAAPAPGLSAGVPGGGSGISGLPVGAVILNAPAGGGNAAG